MIEAFFNFVRLDKSTYNWGDDVLIGDHGSDGINFPHDML